MRIWSTGPRYLSPCTSSAAVRHPRIMHHLKPWSAVLLFTLLCQPAFSDKYGKMMMMMIAESQWYRFNIPTDVGCFCEVQWAVRDIYIYLHLRWLKSYSAKMSRAETVSCSCRQMDATDACGSEPDSQEGWKQMKTAVEYFSSSLFVDHFRALWSPYPVLASQCVFSLYCWVVKKCCFKKQNLRGKVLCLIHLIRKTSRKVCI